MRGRVEVVPAELAAAAGPVREAATVLDEVADTGRALREFVQTAPSASLRDAFRDCLRAYELPAWELADEAGWLAQRLTDAAGYYADLESSLATGGPHLPPRTDMPLLHDAAGDRPAPAPQPAPAPTAPR